MDISFFYDVVCPYAYVASTRVARVAASVGATVRWRPVLLGGLFQHVQGVDNPSAGFSASKARLSLLDLHRQAERAGVPYTPNPVHPQRSVEAMRLLTAANDAQRVALSHAIFRHYHVEGGSIDREGLAPLAATHGLDLNRIDEASVKDALRAETAAAAELGAFGVPTFAVGGRIWWGNDRLDDFAAAIGALPDPPQIQFAPDVAPARLRFFHDFSSPYSYVAAKRVQALAQAAGAELVWSPILLGAVFQALGGPLVPLATFSAAKQRWVAQDMTAQAARYQAPFRFPTAFPLRTVTALRVALIEPAATDAIYSAAWAEDRDIGQSEILARVLDDAGFRGAELVARAPEARDALRQNTDEAVAIGVCGAPSMRVERADGSNHLFWGQDRMDMVLDALRGWRPTDG